MVEMNPRQELLARLDHLQSEIVAIDGLLKLAVGTKAGARLICDLFETVNAIEALLLVKS